MTGRCGGLEKMAGRRGHVHRDTEEAREPAMLRPQGRSTKDPRAGAGEQRAVAGEGESSQRS